MHKLVWNRMEFPIQQKREECFRNQNSLLPVFLLQHKYHVHTSLPTPRKEEERAWVLTFWWSGVMERSSRYSLGGWLWRACRSALPFNRQIRVWLVTRRGSSHSPSIVLFPVLGFCRGALSPSHHRWFLRDGTKMQHGLSVWFVSSLWRIFIKWSGFYLNGGREVRTRSVLV